MPRCFRDLGGSTRHQSARSRSSRKSTAGRKRCTIKWQCAGRRLPPIRDPMPLCSAKTFVLQSYGLKFEHRPVANPQPQCTRYAGAVRSHADAGSVGHVGEAASVAVAIGQSPDDGCAHLRILSGILFALRTTRGTIRRISDQGSPSAAYARTTYTDRKSNLVRTMGWHHLPPHTLRDFPGIDLGEPAHGNWMEICVQRYRGSAF